MSTRSIRLSFLPLALAALVLLGAGCTSSAPSSSTPIPSTPAPTTETPVAPMPSATWTFPGTLPNDQIAHKQIRISTVKGDIVIALDAEHAPKTVSNFVYLTNGGYFNGLNFHRREENFVIQGGDPKGNGTGGPGYKFEDELAADSRWEAVSAAIQQSIDQRSGYHVPMFWYRRGTVAMANAGANTNGSQFFLMLADQPLPKSYTIFGKVTSGLDVMDQIKVGDVMTKVTVEDVK